MLVADIVALPAGATAQTAGDMATLSAILVLGVGMLIAAGLNRAGLVSTAGTLIVLLLTGAVMGAVVSAPNGQLDTIYLPAYDLLAIGVVVGASILPRIAAFVIAFLNIGLILGDFYLQPKVGDLALQLQTRGVLALVARPVALEVIVAVVAFLWVRSADEAIRRADRAEEIAALEHTLADQKRQLDIGVQQLLQTHVRIANGDFTARAPLGQDHLLWQIASSLNNLVARMQRAGQAEHQLRRTEEELRRLAQAIDDAQAGRQAFWPVPTGTAADLIIERVARGSRRRVAAPAPMDPGLAASLGINPTPQGWPSQSSTPLSQTPYPAQGWPSQSSTPLAPGDRWGQEAPSSGPAMGFGQGMPDPPANNPWAFPSQEPDQPEY
jgi:hypothetical protein